MSLVDYGSSSDEAEKVESKTTVVSSHTATIQKRGEKRIISLRLEGKGSDSEEDEPSSKRLKTGGSTMTGGVGILNLPKPVNVVPEVNLEAVKQQQKDNKNLNATAKAAAPMSRSGIMLPTQLKNTKANVGAGAGVSKGASGGGGGQARLVSVPQFVSSVETPEEGFLGVGAAAEGPDPLSGAGGGSGGAVGGGGGGGGGTAPAIQYDPAAAYRVDSLPQYLAPLPGYAGGGSDGGGHGRATYASYQGGPRGSYSHSARAYGGGGGGALYTVYNPRMQEPPPKPKARSVYDSNPMYSGVPERERALLANVEEISQSRIMSGPVFDVPIQKGSLKGASKTDRQRNQITVLAAQAAESAEELALSKAAGKRTKAETHAKYGW